MPIVELDGVVKTLVVVLALAGAITGVYAIAGTSLVLSILSVALSMSNRRQFAAQAKAEAAAAVALTVEHGGQPSVTDG